MHRKIIKFIVRVSKITLQRYKFVSTQLIQFMIEDNIKNDIINIRSVKNIRLENIRLKVRRGHQSLPKIRKGTHKDGHAELH
jgi:hypothetical protein